VAIGLESGFEGQEQPLMASLVERILIDAPVPVLLARAAAGQLLTSGEQASWLFEMVLVPLTIESRSRAATEIAAGAVRDGTRRPEVVLLHVVREGERHGAALRSKMGLGKRLAPEAVGGQLLTEQARILSSAGAKVRRMVRRSSSVGAGVVLCAQQVRSTLVVMATEVRVVDGRAFLGAAVDDVLDHCSCALAMVALPRTVEDLGHQS